MVCQYCGKGVEVEVTRNEVVSLVVPGGSVEVHVVTPYITCDTCGFEGFGAAGEAARDGAVATAIAAHMADAMSGGSHP